MVGKPRKLLYAVDLLTLFPDPMSRLDPSDFDGGKWTSGSQATMQFINPQCMQQGFMTPEPSPTDVTPRRESFAIPENRNTYFSDSSAASSFMFHSGCGTPSFSTPGSSASSSRRQSMLLPESQQHYLSAFSSSPSDRPQRSKRAVAGDQYHLQGSLPGSYIPSTDTTSLISDGTAACTSGDELTMVVNGYTGEALTQLQSYAPQTDTSSLYGRAAQFAQFHGSTSWNQDFVPDFAARASQIFDFDRTLFGPTQPTIFENSTSQPDVEGAGQSSPSVPPLAPAFDGYPGRFATEGDLVDDETVPNATAGHPYSSDVSVGNPPSGDDLEYDHATSPVVKSRNRRRAPFKLEVSEPLPKRKTNQCHHPDCPYACNRLEHLRRHKNTVHGENIVMLPCKFDGCWDRKKEKRREIMGRFDNLKAHYKQTHFRYGSSEKGGKNERKSMKVAQEMGLGIYDHRWTLLLENKMDINQEIKGSFHVWKMLGYSIRETRDMKVKDVVPDWPVQVNETLQKYDPRWRGLWDGTLTFDKAMSVGHHMKESEAQGLLGNTMLETEAMGIKHLDPRWTAMLDGRMSVEQSEKLGVKQMNPVWINLAGRRKAR